jgi:hypothetical protein
LKIVPKWTGEAVKKKHLHDINDSDIANVIGKSREVVSKTLNGSYSFKDDRKIIMEAIDKLISTKNEVK